MSARAAWEAQAARRSSASGTETAEDEILRVLLSGEPNALDTAARLSGTAQLLDRDYLAYWVDELELQAHWRKLG
jgi:hypothetical protein